MNWGSFPAHYFDMRFQKNILLKNYTTFKIGGKAKYFFIAKTKLSLIKAIQTAKNKNLPFFILGGGSNLLISDKGFNGLVIKIENCKLKIENSNIITEAGVSLGQLASATSKVGLTGLEWAAGIPGTVAGAIRGNAGAFGKSMADVVKTVEVFDVKQNKIRKLGNKECQFGYRNSIFSAQGGSASGGKKNPNLIILSAEIRLKKSNSKKIKKYLEYRKKTQPLNFPSAGSIFKNPPGFSAAYLIDECGLKGKKIGGAQISEIHPNFIINLDGASSQDILKLINLVKKKVKNKFGIKLEEEIQKFL